MAPIRAALSRAVTTWSAKRIPISWHSDVWRLFCHVALHRKRGGPSRSFSSEAHHWQPLRHLQLEVVRRACLSGASHCACRHVALDGAPRVLPRSRSWRSSRGKVQPRAWFQTLLLRRRQASPRRACNPRRLDAHRFADALRGLHLFLGRRGVVCALFLGSLLKFWGLSPIPVFQFYRWHRTVCTRKHTQRADISNMSGLSDGCPSLRMQSLREPRPRDCPPSAGQDFVVSSQLRAARPSGDVVIWTRTRRGSSSNSIRTS